MTRPVPLIRASTLRPLVDYLARNGVRPTAALERGEAALRDPASLIPLALGGLLWDEAARVTGVAALGMRIGLTTRVESIGALGALVRRAPTVGAAIEAAVRFGSCFNSGQRYWLVHRGDEVRLHRSYTRALRFGRLQVNDFATMLSLGLIRLAAGADWRPTEIHFEGAPPRHADELAALAERSARFEQPASVLVFPRSLFALELPPPSPQPTGELGTSGATPVGALPDVDFVGSVRQTIASLMRLGSSDVGVVAEAAGTSVRSIQRRLAEAGTSFGRLVEEARLEAAREMLRDPDIRIIEISAELGYTDSANFTRAFRRWTGLPPREFRRLAGVQRRAAPYGVPPPGAAIHP